MKVLIAGGGTGGHLMPALAIADALRTVRADVEPVLVGARRGIEARILPERGRYAFYLLPVEPIHRRAWWRNAKWLWTLVPLLRECRRILDRERPVLAVGTGGYAAGPILSMCDRRGVPFALQEQNAVPGLTTRRLARRAAQIHLGFPEAAEHLQPGSHTVLFTLGNPITPPPADRPDRAAAQRALGIVEGARVCFVMGGSQGARSINRAVAAALESGALDDVTVLWSTGLSALDEYHRYHAPPHRLVRSFWDPVAHAYAAADLVVARAGAMTTSELAAWGLPSILIPLPTAAADHQTRNAVALERAGSAVHLAEAHLDPDRLAGRIMDLLTSPERLQAMALRASERSHLHAAEHIAEQLLTLVE